MSLPQFDVQGSLFESLGAIAPDLFKENDKYKLFARKVWPGASTLPARTGGVLPTKQWPTGDLAGGLARGIDFPVFRAGTGSPSRGAGEVSSGLEAGAELKIERGRLSSHHLGLLSSAAD